MTSAQSHSRDAGSTLIETLVTLVIVAISVVVLVGGLGAAIVGSEHHRRQAVGQAGIRNFSETVKAATYNPDCLTAPASYQRAYSPSPPTRIVAGANLSSASHHVAPSVGTARPNSRLLSFYTLAGGSALALPSGMEPRWNVTSSALDQTNQVRAGLADQAWAGTGAPGTRVADSTAAVDSVVQSLVLNSATEANGSVAWHGSRPAELVTDATKLAFITPANTVKDDAMIVQIAARGGAATSVTPPVGWLLVDARDNGLAIKSMIYERTATSNATETYTWTFGSAPQATGGIVSYGGASTESRASVDEVQVWDPDTAKFKPCPAGGAPDGGLQRVTLTVESNDGRFLENVDVVKRKP